MKQRKRDSSIATELMTEGYVSRARERAKRRKSPWNLLLLPLVIIGVFGVSIGLFTLLWHLNVWVYPQHVGKLREIMGSSDHTASQFLMTLPSFFAGIPLGMLFANCVAWCIPPASRTFEHEAKGIACASFRKSMSGLGKVVMYVVLVWAALGIVGALTLR
jgi:hypothetical protein